MNNKKIISGEHKSSVKKQYLHPKFHEIMIEIPLSVLNSSGEKGMETDELLEGGWL